MHCIGSRLLISDLKEIEKEVGRSYCGCHSQGHHVPSPTQLAGRCPQGRKWREPFSKHFKLNDLSVQTTPILLANFDSPCISVSGSSSQVNFQRRPKGLSLTITLFCRMSHVPKFVSRIIALCRAFISGRSNQIYIFWYTGILGYWLHSLQVDVAPGLYVHIKFFFFW